jgi:hypothetical protein
MMPSPQHHQLVGIQHQQMLLQNAYLTGGSPGGIYRPQMQLQQQQQAQMVIPQTNVQDHSFFMRNPPPSLASAVQSPAAQQIYQYRHSPMQHQQQQMILYPNNMVYALSAAAQHQSPQFLINAAGGLNIISQQSPPVIYHQNQYSHAPRFSHNSNHSPNELNNSNGFYSNKRKFGEINNGNGPNRSFNQYSNNR